MESPELKTVPSLQPSAGCVWVGHYVKYRNKNMCNFTEMKITEKSIAGKGKDPLGLFSFEGEVTEDGEFKAEMTYEKGFKLGNITSKHSVYYWGQL